ISPGKRDFGTIREYSIIMVTMAYSFTPLISRWFSEKYGTPTAAQEAAWSMAEEGRHFLLSAPTGSGKTLSAFLYAIDQLIREGGEETVRILYVSPLKALNSDIRRNLETPLQEIRDRAEKEGVELPPVRVGLRSGDTDSSERQRQFRHPPSIFITTPESLNLILTSGRGADFFGNLITVIIDELHSLMPGKRGVHLITAVERLTLYSGEFQRIGLSATVQPRETACAWLGGFDPSGKKRVVEWLEPVIQKKKEIRVSYPYAGTIDPEHPMEKLISTILERVAVNRSTLVFVPTRSMAESLTRMINEETGDLTAYAHHGSLSREIRSSVEERMKAGKLKAIIATSSLELGIDIGALDEVIQVGTPVSQAVLIQRLGRSGHTVGGISRGLLLPLSPTDLIFAASAARSVTVNEVEEMVPPSRPLDILCQVILSMGCTARWLPDDLYAFIRQCWTYRDLSRRQFDLVLGLLEGRYAETRIPELTPRIFRDPESGEIFARDSAPSLLYMSGGSIADRGNYRMVLAEGGTRIGDLDEKFVWENRVGSVFPMTGRMWKITAVGDRDVKVAPTGERPSSTPFWRAEGIYGPPLPARRTGELLKELARMKVEEALEYLQSSCFLDREAAETLMDQLQDYSDKCREAWPHRSRIIQEIHRSPSGGADDWVMILHTFRGGKINFLLALTLASYWEEEYRQDIPFLCDEASIILHLPDRQRGEALLERVCSRDIDTLIRKGLESTAFFGTHFRETASRALLLPRRSFNRRQPLWLTRQKSGKLLKTVAGYEDFPVLAETWRTCLQDETSPAGLRELIDQLNSGQAELITLYPKELPRLSLPIMGRETAARIASDDTPPGSLVSELSDSIMKEMLAGNLFRPRIRMDVIAEFEAKRNRTWPGYAPVLTEDLMLHLEDRGLIPLDEWKSLLKAAAEQRKEEGKNCSPLPEISAAGDGRYVTFSSAQAEALPPGWLNWYGPVPLSRIDGLLGVPRQSWLNALSSETEDFDETYIIDYLSEDAREPEICTMENLEILLRMQRRKHRAFRGETPCERLPLFLARRQGLCFGPPIRPNGPGNGQATGIKTEAEEELKKALEPLLGCPLPAALWEEDILPARIPAYSSRDLDSLILKGELLWTGLEKGRILFSIPEEYPLFKTLTDGSDKDGPDNDETVENRILSLLREGPLDFSGLKTRLAPILSTELNMALWSLVWQGLVWNSRPETLRQGIHTSFKEAPLHREAPEEGAEIRRMQTGGGLYGSPRRERGFSGRSRFSRWNRSLAGEWLMTTDNPAPDETDPMEANEISKEKVRLLLDRYGIIFRELVNREKGFPDWKECFTALRQMEFSGEVLSGAFFKGIRGIQFITP
ncbi:MAG: DEAD/DEAH box helicase, partial [Spirochaetales bacterium]|nr:DEAD/DEAH box helicase [Spirochaetales bacterium]